MDRYIFLSLGLVIFSLVGLIAFNLFAPQSEIQSGPSEVAVVQDLLNKADEMIGLRQYGLAGETLKDALNKATKVSGPEGPEVGNVYLKLAELEKEQKKLNQAVLYWEKALSIFEHSKGMEYESLISTIVSLSEYWYRSGDYERTEFYIRHGLKAAEAAHDEANQSKFWRSLALVKRKQKKETDAEDYDSKAESLGHSE